MKKERAVMPKVEISEDEKVRVRMLTTIPGFYQKGDIVILDAGHAEIWTQANTCEILEG